MPRAITTSLAALLLMNCAAEAEEPTSAQPALAMTGRVVDAANILSEAFEDEMTEKLAALEAETGVQMVIATTPDLEDRDIAAYSLDLANAWGIGSAERDDGLLLLIAPDQRQARIEVGYGLEASVKDEEAADILQNAVFPDFQNGNYEAGIAKGVERLVREVTPYKLDKAA